MYNIFRIIMIAIIVILCCYCLQKITVKNKLFFLVLFLCVIRIIDIVLGLNVRTFVDLNGVWGYESYYILREVVLKWIYVITYVVMLVVSNRKPGDGSMSCGNEN